MQSHHCVGIQQTRVKATHNTQLGCEDFPSGHTKVPTDLTNYSSRGYLIYQILVKWHHHHIVNWHALSCPSLLIKFNPVKLSSKSDQEELVHCYHHRDRCGLIHQIHRLHSILRFTPPTMELFPIERDPAACHYHRDRDHQHGAVRSLSCQALPSAPGSPAPHAPAQLAVSSHAGIHSVGAPDATVRRRAAVSHLFACLLNLATHDELVQYQVHLPMSIQSMKLSWLV